MICVAYDVPKLALYADWLSLMAYDYHGYWDSKTGHIAPLYKERKDDLSDHFNVVSNNRTVMFIL